MALRNTLATALAHVALKDHIAVSRNPTIDSEKTRFSRPFKARTKHLLKKGGKKKKK